MQTKEQGCCSAMRLQGWRQPGVCGLDNSGNSCYLNAVLQCLCSTVPLVEHLLHQGTRKQLARHKCQVAEVFVRLLEEMWLGRSSRCTPAEARSAVCSIHPQFNNYSQQDAQELLLFLLNALHDDLKRCSYYPICTVNPPSKCPAAEGEPTVVSHLFEGQLSYRTLCTHCSHQAHSTQSFTVLSLPIPKDTTKCSLQDCLSLFFQASTLTGGDQMLCSVCGVRRNTTILTALDKPPEILMLHLKRFGCKGKKNMKLKTNVLFSMENLDLTPFLSSPSAQHTSYCLYAVVNHTGQLDMGHYTALCRNALTRSWYCFDDSVVSEVQDCLVQSSNAYILLYSRGAFNRPKISGL
ncbi:putative ubiquitin carboxyl-terminal hydrolase 50 [Myripristis murdjan]|uniref:putative ubiquitin carboxyl-terminal hydrolase 50 n=1 Tax=Myripristis murdjan TaxID=586833 RepID=UPI0011761D72|nr:inactive ubiquitin carboxyl-terminal hydrolase 50 [Myripristis murdjan]